MTATALLSIVLATAPLAQAPVDEVQEATATTTTAADANAADDAFARLSALAGTWHPAGKPGSALRIRFYLTAGGTVLVEEWTGNGAPHSLTLYHRDGAALIATHYCPQGNQPRLMLVPTSEQLAFTFRDATDLDPGEAMQHDLAFDLRDPARIIRSETYRQGDEVEADSLTLERVRESGAE